MSTFASRSTTVGVMEESDESVDVIEHLKRIPVRQRHPDDGVNHLPEIDDFTFPPPSGRIMQEEKKRRREGRAGIEKEGKGRAGFPRHFGGWARRRLIKQLFPI